MENKKIRHVEIPHNMEKINYIDRLVYTYLRSHMDKDSLTTFVSMDKLAEESGISKPTIIKSIKKLKENKEIEVTKKGRSNLYTFKNKDNFEMFTYEFLKNKDLSPEEKAFCISTQEYMYKDSNTGLGSCTYSNKDLCDKLGISRQTLKVRQRELIEKEILSITDTKVKDPETGLYNFNMSLDLNKIGQAILYLAEQTDKNTNDIDKLKKEVEQLKQILRDQQKDSYKDTQIIID